MKNIFKALSGFTAGVATIAVLCQQAQAGPISGTINMSGDVTFNTTSLATATDVESLAAVSVSSGTQSFIGTGGAPVTFNPFSFSSTGTENVSPLWSFTVAGTAYSFDLADINTIDASATFLEIIGSGIVNVGTSSQTANWTFTVTDSSGGNSGQFTFGFANSNTAIGVPDGGTTVILLGATLSGICLLRKKLAKTT
ncbi:MAG: hypothetical protein ABSE48_12070 [Verrucomicrobiota bacterium]|jgi:hypothetical protein